MNRFSAICKIFLPILVSGMVGCSSGSGGGPSAMSDQGPDQTSPPTPLSAPSTSTTEINLGAAGAIPCETQSDADAYDCLAFKAVVDADDPTVTLDDPLQLTNVLLVVRKKKETPWENNWIVLEAGGHGKGYAATFGRVAPGEYVEGGLGYGDDLIRWYNDAGYITLDVVWECQDKQSGNPCYGGAFAGWVPEYTDGTGWFRNTGGAGYVGASSRTRAVVQWVLANNGGRKVGAHGHSSGSGRLMATLTRYNAASLFDTIVFDGGPVFAYVPWYCGITDDGDPNNVIATPGPLGPKPSGYDIEAYANDGSSGFRDNYDNARDANNGEGADPYQHCTKSLWDEATMLEDSNFYNASSRQFQGLHLVVVLGGKDRSPASPHARLWFQGYAYGGGNIPALSAEDITFYQGYCSDVTDSGGNYTANTQPYPCTHWDPARFPTVNAVLYQSDLADVTHSTAESLAGATALFNAMQERYSKTAE